MPLKVNPDALQPNDNKGACIAARNARLLSVVQSMLDSIASSYQKITYDSRVLCFVSSSRIYEEIEHRFPGQGLRRVGALLFLRVICPTLINP